MHKILYPRITFQDNRHWVVWITPNFALGRYDCIMQARAAKIRYYTSKQFNWTEAKGLP